MGKKILCQWVLSTVWFCVQQKRETHTDLEELEVEKPMTKLSFLGELSLYTDSLVIL